MHDFFHFVPNNFGVTRSEGFWAPPQSQNEIVEKFNVNNWFGFHRQNSVKLERDISENVIYVV